MKWRMPAIAAALFLLVPVGIGTGQDPILDLWGEASAIVTNIELLPPQQNKTYDPNEFFAHEQLVEGHTTFATIEFRANVTVDAGNYTIDGTVECKDHIRGRGPVIFGFVIPGTVDEAHVECRVGQRVIITPDPFTGDPGFLGGGGGGGGGGSGGSAPAYAPTGEVRPIRTPNGQFGYIEELVFEHDGKTWYAWATTVMKPWERDGTLKNFIAPLPTDKLRLNDAASYRVILESDL